MAKESSFKYVEDKKLGKFPYVIIYALLEWMLMIMLFIDGFIAFAANEFAQFFGLKMPCLLCTRLDHVLVDKKHDYYYNNSICESHQKNISSLAYCQVHKKLSEIKEMCEGCLLSFATEKESDCDTYKSLVGILHKDVGLLVDGDQDLQLTFPSRKKEDPVGLGNVDGSILKRCACCKMPMKVRRNPQPKGKNPVLISVAPTPSPRFAPTLRNEENRIMDLPNVRFKELKFPDTESDHPEVDDVSRGKRLSEDIKSATMPLVTESDDTKEEKTPISARANRFFGLTHSDSAQNSPRWTPRAFRKSPLERTENASDSTEANATNNEVDGDMNSLHSKKEVRLDHKSLMDLYMELDEERSASAIAANNAMAMITRLQAEKAAVHMEALQYQRMMEEQAEYDQEALQAMNEMLTKRSKQIKELEAELEEFREKYGCIRENNYKVQGDIIDEDAYLGNYQDMRYQSYSSPNNAEEPEYNPRPIDYSAREWSNVEVGLPPDEIDEERTPDISPKGDTITNLDSDEALDQMFEISSDIIGILPTYPSTENLSILDENSGEAEEKQ